MKSSAYLFNQGEGLADKINILRKIMTASAVLILLFYFFLI
jgi:hypothetical protein